MRFELDPLRIHYTTGVAVFPVRMKKRGFLGGTFDPVHAGHLRLAVECLEQFNLDSLHLLPAPTPNLRATPGANPAQRLAMLELAVAGTGLEVDAREIGRDGVTYTVDTLQALREQYPADALCFILGQDAFNGLARWHRWEALTGFAHLVVATRPGYRRPTEEPLASLLRDAETPNPERLVAQAAGCIFLATIPLLPISATDLRTRVREGRSIAALTPQPVVEYIRDHALYR